MRTRLARPASRTIKRDARPTVEAAVKPIRPRLAPRQRGRSARATARAALVSFAILSASSSALFMPANGSADPPPTATATASEARMSQKSPTLVCKDGATLASGRPDATLFSAEASRGVRALWCETYDPNGRAIRVGPYLEVEADGSIRTFATYVDSRLEGPVAIRYSDGRLFLKGFLKGGAWSGPLTIFHPNGRPWFEARFVAGRLEGALRTRYPDGALESETRYQHGREDGLARSFYPTAAGGRLKSEVHVEADQLMGEHRLLDRAGRLVRSTRGADAPASWRRRSSAPTD